MPAVFRRGAAVVLASFLLGAILMQGPMLKPILFNGGIAPTAEDHARVQRNFIRWWNAPATIKTLLHTDLGLLIIALASKFAHWTEEAFFFDGACLLGVLALYLAVVVPGLQNVARTSLSKNSLVTRFVSSGYGHPSEMPQLSEDEMQAGIAVTGAAIVLIAALLATVIFLQAGEFYAVEVVQAREEIAWRKSEAARIAGEQQTTQRLKAE